MEEYISGSNAANGELLEAIKRVHGCVHRMLEGDPQDLTDDALSTLVADAARLYAGACASAGHEIKVKPQGLTATDAVLLIGALMQAQNLNTFDLSLWHRPV